MRVIAGKARSLRLKTPEGPHTRPTTDRIKETLFNILSQGQANLFPGLAGASFLDLFAGSGAMGIEALSRGARQAVFVEKNRKALQCIRDNLTHTHLSDQARILSLDVMKALASLDREETAFDYIFMDPPYGKGLEARVLSCLSGSRLLSDHTMIIVESDRETDFSTLSDSGLRIVKEKIYKTNRHTFIMKDIGL